MGRKRKSDKNIMVGTTLPPHFIKEIVDYVDLYYNKNLSEFFRDAAIEKYKREYKK